VIATDSLGQARAYKPPFCLAGTRHMDRMVSLGAVIEHASPGRTAAAEVTLFCSVGLAGTEVYLLAEMIHSQQP
jgi:alanine dehydrogenase